MGARDALPTAVAEAIEAARARFPGVRLDQAQIEERLARETSSAADPIAALGDLRAADLFLASACVAGDPTALREIDRILTEEAARAASSLGQPAWVAEEVEQVLRQRLLVADGDTPPRLAGYAGRSGLPRWIGVAATRIALNLIRDRRKETDLDAPRLAALASPADDPDLDLLRRRHREDLESAIRGAFASLDSPRDRNLLRLYYFDRVGLEGLGRLYGVHGSTVSRWLATVRQQLFEETQRLLAEQMRISRSDLQSLFRILESDLDLTLSQVLDTAR